MTDQPANPTERDSGAASAATGGGSGGPGESGASVVSGGPRGLGELGRSPGFGARIGLAVIHPRWALTLAGDRRYAGRSGSDLIAAFAILLLATQLRGLASAVLLGSAVEVGLGLRAVLHVLTGALAIDLGLLVIGALAVFALAGPRRNLGRAFDLACVAALPLVLVDLVATVAVRTLGNGDLPIAVSWVLSALAYGWMGALIALATRTARTVPTRVPEPPAAVVHPARLVGLGIAGLALLGIAGQAMWIVDNVDLVRPIRTGDAAPAFALPRIEPGGELGAPVSLVQTRGKVTVLDFWATWCKPCLVALPRLEKLARAHSDVAVLAIDLDDPAAARALFDERGYTMTLLAEQGDVRDRYGVSSIPHTVIIDRRGVVRHVVRGSATDVTALVEAIRASE